MRAKVEVFAAAVAIFLACLGGGGAASAQPFEHHAFQDQQSIVVSWCGSDATFRNDFNITGVVTARVTGRDGTIRYTQTAHGEAVWTNLATQLSITIRWDQNSQDLRVTDNGDGTLSILFQGSGSTKIYGPNNELVGNAPGNFRLLTIVDHGGTVTDPSDDTIISETFVSGHGHEPAESECETFRRLTT